jgi:hypothetical protein
MAKGLHGLQGEAYEIVYMQEVEFFKDAQSGVDGNDIAGALILRDGGRFDLLRKLHNREIHFFGVDEDSKFEDLEFE